MTARDIISGRISMREEAAALVEKAAGKQPCDCVEKMQNGFWRDQCGCRNYDDKGRVSAWCADMNTAVAIRTIPDMQSIHDSDCALHNMPAYPNEPCDCSLTRTERGEG
jgi:hypothetical protein